MINYTLNWSDDTLKTPFVLTGGAINTFTAPAKAGAASVNGSL